MKKRHQMLPAIQLANEALQYEHRKQANAADVMEDMKEQMENLQITERALSQPIAPLDEQEIEDQYATLLQQLAASPEAGKNFIIYDHSACTAF